MENKINLVDILKKQHRVLINEVIFIKDRIGSINDMKVSLEIFLLLKQFETDLDAHLELENHVFYVNLLKKMKEDNLNTNKTEKFIGEMKDLEKTIKDFLGKFNSSGLIQKKQEDFKVNFLKIYNALELRVSSEELGVYTYWEELIK